MKCPKCNYERQAFEIAPDTECPRCGVIYRKAKSRDSHPACMSPAVPARGKEPFRGSLNQTGSFSGNRKAIFNFDMVARRIGNSLALLAHREGPAAGDRAFGPTFRELPFVDLIQALAQSQRNVRLRVARRNGESAVIYLRNGQMVHGRCGRAIGEEAVCRIIHWRDDGSFRLEPVREFPPENIFSPNDYVLMEGLRLLDESALVQRPEIRVHESALK